MHVWPVAHLGIPRLPQSVGVDTSELAAGSRAVGSETAGTETVFDGAGITAGTSRLLLAIVLFVKTGRDRAVVVRGSREKKR